MRTGNWAPQRPPRKSRLLGHVQTIVNDTAIRFLETDISGRREQGR